MKTLPEDIIVEAVGSTIRTKRTGEGGGFFIADCFRNWQEPGEFAFDGSEADENARRLSACWNKFHGMSIDEIEAMPCDIARLLQFAEQIEKILGKDVDALIHEGASR
jgi:hypothetical protein